MKRFPIAYSAPIGGTAQAGINGLALRRPNSGQPTGCRHLDVCPAYIDHAAQTEEDQANLGKSDGIIDAVRQMVLVRRTMEDAPRQVFHSFAAPGVVHQPIELKSWSIRSLRLVLGHLTHTFAGEQTNRRPQ
jgi:hypothetical protein